jgi:hypothetical protein
MSNDHTAKMAPDPDAPAGLETDGKGNVIPFAERTKDDQEKAQGGLKDAMQDASVKNPENEAKNPAPMPQAQQGQGSVKPGHHDLEGQQGGTEGGGHEDR